MKPRDKGEPMPQTVEAWREWGDGVELCMLEQKKMIERLKQTNNKLVQQIAKLKKINKELK